MKTAHTLAAILVIVLSFPFLAQRANSNQREPNPTQQQPSAPAAGEPTAAPTAQGPSAASMSNVTGELVERLDSKTAKTGDSVVIKTKSKVKTVDGTEIPKGSKLVGHVTGVKPSGQGNENSQVSLQFDRAELKGGQTVRIQTQIQSLSLPESELPSNANDALAASPSGAPAGTTPGASGSMPGGAPRTPAGGATPSPSQPGVPSSSGPASASPEAGTVVARSGNIAIRTTAIPGVLLANNEPGQQDPRMGQSSGILIGARRDIHLDGGTQVVIGVASATGAPSGGGN
jgi:hypothetical protein